MPDRSILLTGASSGIGFEAAVRLCRAGHRLTLPCRDRPTAEATIRRVTERAAAGPRPEAPVCDLADLASVERCAEALLERGVPIDTLGLNAGLQYAGAREPLRSAQGLELTFAVNHLAQQLLARRLVPLLVAGTAPRLVVTTSEVHDPASGGGRVGRPAGLGDLAGLAAGPGFAMADGHTPFDAEKAYKDSKLCNLLFSREFARRVGGLCPGLAVIAWSPGLVIPRTAGGFFRTSRTHNELGQRVFALVARDLLRLSESVANAGALLAHLAADPACAGPGFHYFVNRLVRPGRHRFGPAEPSAEARDGALARVLWERSEDLLRTCRPPG
ncbi:MAG: SDR family NAD(P)-dependent oxidoreductase [Synechococcaceae cyanobacterium]|nr:SDR family NAD(P)-dependent oxidoreductase [Synechococcaceae cyanobacterium]